MIHITIIVDFKGCWNGPCVFKHRFARVLYFLAMQWNLKRLKYATAKVLKNF
jgi:hypothetical protein